MVGFFRESSVVGKKPNRCEGCNGVIQAGESHKYMCGKDDDVGFWTARQHTECRGAEISLNHHFETDEWESLEGLVNGWGNCAEREEALALMAEKFPTVRARFGPSYAEDA